MGLDFFSEVKHLVVSGGFALQTNMCVLVAYYPVKAGM